MLLLKRHLVELVRTGQKRQTIRLWSKPLLRPGQISYTPGLGKMKITAIDKLSSLAALTEADARADGFATLAALMAEIRRIYGDKPPANRHVYRIRFSWPIDAAGKTLILPRPVPAPQKSIIRHAKSRIDPAPVPAPAIQKSKIKKAAGRKSSMTPTQRQSLRSFILARRPTR